jgi:hypothetical protein
MMQTNRLGIEAKSWVGEVDMAGYVGDIKLEMALVVSQPPWQALSI